MSALPLNLIKGTRNVQYERLENTEDIEEVNLEIERLRLKVRGSCIHMFLKQLTEVICFTPVDVVLLVMHMYNLS